MNLTLVLLILCALWLGSEIVVVGFKHSKSSDRSDDRSSLTVIWVVIFLSINGGVILQFQTFGRIVEWSEAFRIAGIALIALGILLRWVAIFSLKARFTVDVAITAGHRLVTHGIYGYVRHPAYGGSLISFLGVGLYFSNVVSLLVIFLPVCAAFLFRIRVEESVLKKEFGEEYQRYCDSTKRLIPGFF